MVDARGSKRAEKAPRGEIGGNEEAISGCNDRKVRRIMIISPGFQYVRTFRRIIVPPGSLNRRERAPPLRPSRFLFARASTRTRCDALFNGDVLLAHECYL